jgi:ubiquinone/menaquinone biosynthesis C-methylase UbiE
MHLNWDKIYFDESFKYYNEKDGNRWGMNWRASMYQYLKFSINFLKKIEIGEGIKSILEIGCASGDFTKMLISLYKNNYIYGVDLSEYAIKICKDRMSLYNRASFLVGELPNLQFQDGKFDLVLCMEVLHYFNDELKQKVLLKIIRLMSPEGKAIIVTHEINDRILMDIICRHFDTVTVKYNYTKLYQRYLEPPLLYIYDVLFKRKKLGLFGIPFGWFARILLQSRLLLLFLYGINKFILPGYVSNMLVYINMKNKKSI